VAHRDGQCIRGIVRLWHSRQGQNALNHVLHLVFLGAAVPHYSLLNLGWRVFGPGNPTLRREQQNNAYSPTNSKRSLLILGKKEALGNHNVGLVLVEQCAEPRMNCKKARRRLIPRTGKNYAVIQRRKPRAILTDNAVTGGSYSRIDTEDYHALRSLE